MLVGVAVGACVGVAVGVLVGVAVGACVGVAVGVTIGVTPTEIFFSMLCPDERCVTFSTRFPSILYKIRVSRIRSLLSSPNVLSSQSKKASSSRSISPPSDFFNVNSKSFNNSNIPGL